MIFFDKNSKLKLNSESILHEYIISLVKRRAALLKEIYINDANQKDLDSLSILEDLLSELSKVENLLLVIENNFTFIKGDNK